MALTDAWLKANSGKRISKSCEKTDRDGMSARISPNGKISFQIRYRHDGVPKRLKLGEYPRITLKKARDENDRLRALLNIGHDPKLVKAGEKTKTASEQTFEEAFTSWFNKYRWEEIARPADVLRSFELHVFPTVGNMPTSKLTTLHWLHEIEIITKKTPSIASRVITNIKLFYRWSQRMGFVDVDVVATLSAKIDFKIKKGIVTRTLEDFEIEWLWQAFRGSRVSTRNVITYKLMLLTGGRTQEIRLAEKSHFNMVDQVWTVPAKISKNRRQIKRPIIDEIMPMIELALSLNAKSKWLFISDRTGKPPKGPSVRDSVDCFKNYVEKKIGQHMSHWSPHDLRRTARTKLSKHTQPHIAEKILGHELQGMEKVYDHYDYLDEQREALTKLYYEIEGIVGEV